MTVFRIFYYPHVLLRKVSTPVENFTDEFRAFLKDFVTTMHEFDGGGLAAMQIGVPKRFFMTDFTGAFAHATARGEEFIFEVKNEAGEIITPTFPMVFVNPEIIEKDELYTINWEGCLSFADVERYETKRFKNVTLKAQDEWGNHFTVRSTHFYASACFQHELEHCNGVLLIDQWEKGTYNEKDVVKCIKDFTNSPEERKLIKRLKPIDASQQKYDFL
jgi:peptide deformylase